MYDSTELAAQGSSSCTAILSHYQVCNVKSHNNKMKIDQDTNNVFSLLWPGNEIIASTALDLNLLKTAILFRSETLSISIL